MEKAKHIDKFANAPGCRAKAAALRTTAGYMVNPNFKARMLDMACVLDAQAMIYDDEA